LLAELLLQQRLLCLVELGRAVEAVGQERQAVGPVDLPFVLEVGQQDLADLRLAALHRALDLRRLEQRRVRVHRDLQFAATGFVDVVGELHQVLGVVVARGVAGGQIPLGLCQCGERQRERAEHGSAHRDTAGRRHRLS
jgi:hypothetical protein